jgi:DNA (cytosine-5)-methyltransferase 1
MIDLPKKYSNILKDFKYIDLFAGIGGFRLALDSFGAKCVFTSEWDKHSQDVYIKNFGDEPNGDITKISEKDIPKHDFLFGGFPCQPFSISGKQKGFDDTRGTLFFDIARIAKYHKPKVMILENVKNILTINGGETLSTIKEVLEKELNYSVFIKLLKGNDFGVPQQRERVFFMCFHHSLKIPNFELSNPDFNKYSVRDILEEGRFPEIEINRDDITISDKSPSKDLLSNFPNKPIRIGTINKGGQGERIYHIDGVGITLSAHGGGPGKKTGAYLVNDKIRRLTTRESARMMGFPEDFKISSSNAQAYTQFGNAVVVNVVQFIIKDILDKKII